MPLVADHTSSIRQPRPEEPERDETESDVEVHTGDGTDANGDRRILNDKGDVIKIEHANGDVTINIDGQPVENAAADDDKPKGWFDNLVDDIDEGELQRIATELLADINDDITSRNEWIEDRAVGMKLLGLKVEMPSAMSSADSAPVEGMNKARHPLLLEAVLRFQANAQGEMLPTDGPVKIRNDGSDVNLASDDLANALQKDMNHYLTTTASEYYPDTDRMYLTLGFGGTAFKKVYFCPLRNRPVSETVPAEDLIVNQSCTDLGNAKRITHKSMVKPSTIKRLQILGVYKDGKLSDAQQPTLNAVDREKKAQDGVSAEGGIAARDRDREIYEVLCELDIKGYEHKHKGKISGLEIPYRVTIDVSSQQILAISRNYNKSTEKLPVARRVYIKYTFVPGFGFYDIGLLNILGNTTMAVTAAWRELLDAGMFSNFPGFLLSDTGARQNTNIFRIPPGGAALVKTGGQRIQDVVMNLPYKEPSQALMALVSNMVETGQRVGGTSELSVGEGKQEAPVGTTLAQIEQAQKVLNSVHKRIHRAQSQEFELIIECFREHPESFWQRNNTPAHQWDEATFRKALSSYQLVPQADPNTASYLQRALKVMGIKQLQTASPAMYDPIKVDTAVLRTMGWSNPEEFFAPKEAQQKPPPELIQAQAEMANKTKDADSRAKVADAKVAETQEKIKSGALRPKQDAAADPGLGQAKMISSQASLMDAQTRAKELPLKYRDMDLKHHESHIEARNRDEDRDSRERVSILGLAKDIIAHHGQIHSDHALQAKDHAHEKRLQDTAPKPKAAD